MARRLASAGWTHRPLRTLGLASVFVAVRVAMTIAGLTASASPVLGVHLLVLPSGSGLYPTIQAAVDVAVDGDVILLAPGVFTGSGNRDIDLRGKSITVRSQFGRADECVLEPSVGGELHRAFVFQSGEGAGTAVEALTVRGAGALGRDGLNGSGGAVLCINESAPIFRDCVFLENQAESDGGAISCRESSPTFFACRFEGNSAPYGGGLFVDRPCLPFGSLAPPPEVVIERCEFFANSATDGGGLFARGVHSRVHLAGVRFSDNFADHGGGIMIHGALATIDSAAIDHNFAVSEGGGLALESTLFCRPQPADGQDVIEVQLAETILCGNVAGSGGAVHIRGYSARFESCTIAMNDAGDGSGICARSQFPTYPYLPAYVELAGSIVAFGSLGAAVYQDAHSSVFADCTNLFGNGGGDWVGEIGEQFGENGNIALDPLFCNPNSGDLGLMADSPCQDYPGGCGLIGALPVTCEPSDLPDADDPRVARFDTGHPLRLRAFRNPFDDRIEGVLALQAADLIELELLDVVGRSVGRLDLGPRSAGTIPVAWTLGSSLPAGAYVLHATGRRGSVATPLICVR